MLSDSKAKKYFILILTLATLLAQLIDYLVFLYIPENSGIMVLPFFELKHIRNHGGVFGIMQGAGWGFTIFAIIAMGVLIAYMLKSNKLKTYEHLCYGFIAGGAISNILDRFIYGSVIDYFNVIGIPYWHYIFNTADALIHVGLWPLLIFGYLDNKQIKKTEKVS